MIKNASKIIVLAAMFVSAYLVSTTGQAWQEGSVEITNAGSGTGDHAIIYYIANSSGAAMSYKTPCLSPGSTGLLSKSAMQNNIGSFSVMGDDCYYGKEQFKNLSPQPFYYDPYFYGYYKIECRTSPNEQGTGEIYPNQGYCKCLRVDGKTGASVTCPTSK